MKEKKYFELYKKIKEKIILREYKKGQKLPSKRVMADMSGYSVITVEKAYNMLADEGYIMPKEKSGYFVCELDFISDLKGDKKKKNIKYLNEENTSLYKSDFEYSVWIKTIRKVISEKGDLLFIKSPNKGCAVLRNAISDYLLRYRGMVAEPERIIIGSGAEQLYESVVKMLGRDKKYGIEKPSYEQIEAVYRSEGANIRKLKMGKDGIESKSLKNADIDVLHVTPFFSFPTNVTATLQKRYEYLKWAEKGRYIVEDDFNSEFFLPGQPLESLYSLDRYERVIYINTFSKSLSSSMRIGYMILPKKLVSEYDKKLGKFSCSVPVLDQYILAEFIAGGNFERHLNKVRRKLKFDT